MIDLLNRIALNVNLDEVQSNSQNQFIELFDIQNEDLKKLIHAYSYYEDHDNRIKLDETLIQLLSKDFYLRHSKSYRQRAIMSVKSMQSKSPTNSEDYNKLTRKAISMNLTYEDILTRLQELLNMPELINLISIGFNYFWNIFYEITRHFDRLPIDNFGLFDKLSFINLFRYAEIKRYFDFYCKPKPNDELDLLDLALINQTGCISPEFSKLLINTKFSNRCKLKLPAYKYGHVYLFDKDDDEVLDNSYKKYMKIVNRFQEMLSTDRYSMFEVKFPTVHDTDDPTIKTVGTYYKIFTLYAPNLDCMYAITHDLTSEVDNSFTSYCQKYLLEKKIANSFMETVMRFENFFRVSFNIRDNFVIADR